MLKAYILALVRDPFSVEDVFTEVTAALRRCWSEYDSMHPFEEWARGVARRVALKSACHRKRKVSLLTLEVLHSLGAELDLMGDETELEQRKAKLRQCLEELSEVQQRLVQACYFRNISHSEISIALGKSARALDVMLKRVHQGLATCLEKGRAPSTSSHDDKRYKALYEPILYYVDGSLDPEGVAKLDRELRRDPSLEQPLAHLLIQQCLLLEIGREQKIVPRPSALKPETGMRRPIDPVSRSQMRRRWGKRALIAAIGPVLLLAVGFGLSKLKQDFPTVASIQGFDVFLLRKDNQVQAHAGMKLRLDDRIRTSDDGEILLRYGREGADLILRRNSELRFLATDQGKALELRRGGINFDLMRQKSQKPVSITTPKAHLRVLGARFKILADPEATYIEVNQGSVELSSGGPSRSVMAGQYGMVKPGWEEIASIDGASMRGVVLAELWKIRGAAVEQLTQDSRFGAQPDQVVPLFNLATPPETRVGNDTWWQVGVRIRGYLYPPVTGDYTLWVAADDSAEFWLSSNSEPSGSARICWIEQPGNPDEWTKEPNQHSGPVHLETGKRYYFEVLHKQQWSPNFLSIAWEPPGERQAVISGRFLSPYFSGVIQRSWCQ